MRETSVYELLRAHREQIKGEFVGRRQDQAHHLAQGSSRNQGANRWAIRNVIWCGRLGPHTTLTGGLHDGVGSRVEGTREHAVERDDQDTHDDRE